MKNNHKGKKVFTEEEQRMHKSVTYYMQLVDYVLEEGDMLERHDELCRLLATIAGDYPESVAENMGKVLKFPQVRVPGEEVPNSGEEVDMEFEVFVTMFSFEIKGTGTFIHYISF